MSWRHFAVLLGVCVLVRPAFADGDVEFFEKRIRPVLVAECYKCHSASSEKLKGGLRLDTHEGGLKGGESGKAAVVPGDVERSALIEAIRYGNPDLQMPPKKQLSAEMVANFEAWIRAGAVDPRGGDGAVAAAKDPKKHWAFQPVREVAVPHVAGGDWVKSPIDAFVLAKLEGSGLPPSPRADRRTLIRRAYFDLWGLPPTFEEVEAFERDTSTDAFAKVVDRLLASPRYGERWGRYWLDLARYADTKGYVYSDREEVRFVHAHNYRDWVIRALNEDMPYDRFLKLQIAADQMENPAEANGESKTGTGTFFSSPNPDLAAMGFLTVGRRFLGVIHDIVDDRIDVVTRTTQGLSVGCARCHDHKYDPIPTRDYYSLYGVFAATTERTVALAAPPAEKSAEFLAYEAGLKKRTDALNDAMAKQREEAARRARVKSVEYLLAVLDAEKLPDELFYAFRDGNDIYPVIVRQWQQYLLTQQKGWSRVWGPWVEFARRDGRAASEDTSESSKPTNAHVAKALAAAQPQTMRDVANVYGKLLLEADRQWREALKADAKVATLADADWEELRQVLYGADSPVRVPQGSIADLEYYFDEGVRVNLAKLQMEIDKWNIDAPAATPQAVVLEDRPTQGNPRVFRRGNPATPGEEVPRRYLEIVAGPNRKNFEKGSGRLELAEAIANKENPLTARVMVNRIWQWHFGAGLVKTPSDFGMRCELPSHPELLDWLAGEFVRSGWSLKAMHRLIMLSSVYQQGGGDSPAGDVENRLLSHFPEQRLDFEAMHDSLLAASGELDLTAGGRPLEMFKAPFAKRRAVYGRVDRQFLPGVFRVFDFANPDLHSPQRATTTVPQQALFMMNSPFVVERARALARRADVAALTDAAARVRRIYEIVYQRRATSEEVEEGVSYIKRTADDPAPPPQKVVVPDWQYGVGEFDAASGRVKGFAKLPHFSGSAWQGGDSWPDAKFGWAQLTAEGGHAGNDLAHAVIRRWVSPIDGTVSIAGSVAHARSEGDGIVARIVSSGRGELAMWRLFNQRAAAEISAVAVKKGDTIDFLVSIDKTLNSNEFAWAPVIKTEDKKQEWNAKRDFAGPAGSTVAKPLDAWEKYAQVLLMSDELMFVD